MWPKLLDQDPAESPAQLRRLELEAYSSVVTAFRAQGELSKERRKVLNDLSSILNVSVERHKTEVRRAINDEFLSTIARNVNGGADTSADWGREGRRLIPLLRRGTPLTAFTPTADRAKGECEALNQRLLSPSKTRTPSRERKAERDADLMPPPLSDIVLENGSVKAPTFPMPAKPTNPQGDIIVLPSGMLVRVKQEPQEQQPQGKDTSSSMESSANKRRRKRRSQNLESENNLPSYEILTPHYFNPMMAQQQHQQQQHQLQQQINNPRLSGHPFGNSPFLPQQPPAPSATKRRRSQKNAQGSTSRRSSSASSSRKQLQNSTSSSAPSSTTPLPPPPPGFLPQTSNALLELEGKIPNCSFAQPIPMSATQSKMLFVTSSLSLTSPHGIPPSISLPKSPVAVSPHKLINPHAQEAHLKKVANSKRNLNKQMQQQQQQQQTPKTAAATAAKKFEEEASSDSSVTSNSRLTVLQSAVTTTSATSSSSSSTAPTTIQLKEGLRFLPPGSIATVSTGARLLPKSGTSGAAGKNQTTPIYMVATSSTSGQAGKTPTSPVYMVTSSSGQNVMRMAQRVVPMSTSASGGQPRLVTVSAAAFKGMTGNAPMGLRPGQLPIVRTLQPHRSFIATSPSSTGPLRPMTSAASGGSGNSNTNVSRPSVIVVQRTPKHAINAGVGQRILQTKDGKPVVIVSKQPGIPSAALAVTPVTEANEGITTPKSGGNVIVLDLSNEQYTSTTAAAATTTTSSLSSLSSKHTNSTTTTTTMAATSYLSDILHSNRTYSGSKQQQQQQHHQQPQQPQDEVVTSRYESSHILNEENKNGDESLPKERNYDIKKEKEKAKRNSRPKIDILAEAFGEANAMDISIRAEDSADISDKITSLQSKGNLESSRDQLQAPMVVENNSSKKVVPSKKSSSFNKNSSELKKAAKSSQEVEVAAAMAALADGAAILTETGSNNADKSNKS